MTTSSQQQLLDIIPTLKDWQSRCLVTLLQLLRWIPETSKLKTDLPREHPTQDLTPEQKAAITRLQQRIREVVPEGESLAAELIQERRAASLYE